MKYLRERAEIRLVAPDTQFNGKMPNFLDFLPPLREREKERERERDVLAVLEWV